MAQTQRDVALSVADDVFKDNITAVFKQLSFGLSTATNDADIQAAVDRATKGLANSQLAYAKCKDLAQTLPSTGQA